MSNNATLTMVSIAQCPDFRKTIKPHVNEVSFASVARPLASLTKLATMVLR